MLVALVSLTQFFGSGKLLILDHMFAVNKNSSGVGGHLLWEIGLDGQKGRSIQRRSIWMDSKSFMGVSVPPFLYDLAS